MRTLFLVVFAMFFLSISTVYAQDPVMGYEQLRDSQSGLPSLALQISSKWRDCRRIYNSLQSREIASSGELQQCFRENYGLRVQFTETAAPIYNYARLTDSAFLVQHGWTEKQLKNLEQLWKRVKSLARQIGGSDKPNPQFDRIAAVVKN